MSMQTAVAIRLLAGPRLVAICITASQWADIGLTRLDVFEEAQKPFWQS